MKKIYLFVVLLGLMTMAQAQSFVVTPSTTLNTVVDVNGSVDAYIHFTNTSSHQLTLNWAKTGINLPSAWFVNICDNNACYPISSNGNTMSAIMPGDSAFLKVNVSPAGQAGTGSVTYQITDANQPSSTASVTFTFDATPTTGVSLSQSASLIQVGPNPASDVLHLKATNGNLEKGNIQILDTKGQVVLSRSLNAVATADLNVVNLAPGIYLLRYEGKTGSTIQKIVIER